MKQYEKAAIERLNSAYYEEFRDLYSVYANPSKAKCDAWEDILDYASACNGIPTIVTHNVQVFSAAIYWVERTSRVLYGTYITKTHRVTVNLLNNVIVESW